MLGKWQELAQNKYSKFNAEAGFKSHQRASLFYSHQPATDQESAHCFLLDSD